MHSLPDLPYKYDALQPHIDTNTMEIHHGKHHQAYVDNLNKALEDHPNLQDKPLEDLLTDLSSLPADIRTAVQNNGGGHYNHSLFWTIMSPDSGEHPGGELKQAMIDSFGDFDGFKTEFTGAAMTRFGSGWAWMYVDQSPSSTKEGPGEVKTSGKSDTSGALKISSTPNQDNPLMEGHTPILGLDVWEHAYYLHYQNRRADYIDAWFNIINWKQVEDNFANAK